MAHRSTDVSNARIKAQWNLSIKDLRLKDTSLIRTTPVVPAILNHL